MNAVNMAAFIEPKSDQLNADDLIGGPRTVTITRVSANEGSPEQPISIYFEGDAGKPYKPCKSMRRVMVHVWGADASKYVGRSMTLYRDPAVQFGGMQVGGIRISHMSHIEEKKTMALTATRAKRAPFTVLPLKTKVQPADELSVALKALTDAAEEGLDALANVWKQKWMAPHRDALQVDLDRLKVLAAEKGKSEPDQPDEPAEQSPAVNDQAPGFNLADEIEKGADEHPGKAKAEELIAQINAANAVMDITSILARNEADIQSMPDDWGVKVEVAADKRKREIEAARETEGAVK